MKRHYLILPLFFLLMAAIGVPTVSAQTLGTVKGVCKDVNGNPIAGAIVEYSGVETGRKFTLKTNSKGEYFSLGVAPGKYNVKLIKDGKELFHLNNVDIGLDEKAVDFDLKKEQANAAQGQGLSQEQLKQVQEQQAKAAKEQNTVKALNEKLQVANAAMQSGDYDQAINTLNEANQIDASRDLIWFRLGDAYRMSAAKQTDSAEKQKRFEMASTDYQKAIDLRQNNPSEQKDPEANIKMAAYYNNLAEVYAKSNKLDDAVASYKKAEELDPTKAAQYNYNIGAVLTNAGKVDDAIAAFDKVIAADPNKADAYYWKGVNLIGKATLKGDKMEAPPGTAEALQKYLDLAPTGPYAEPAKAMLAQIGATVQTGFGKKKATKPKK